MKRIHPALISLLPPLFTDMDPEAPIAGVVLSRLFEKAGGPSNSLTIAQAILAASADCPAIPMQPVYSAYLAVADTILQEHHYSRSAFEILLRAAALPQSSDPAGFARAIATIADAADIQLSTEFLLAAPLKLSAVLHIRMTVSELRNIQAAAQGHSMSTSEYIRAAVDAYKRQTT